MAIREAKAVAFMRHLETLLGALEAYSRRSLYDQNALRDVLQSATANAYQDFHFYAEGTNFRAWIFRYVHLEIQNWNRKQVRHRAAELPVDISVEEAWQFALGEPAYQVLLDDPEQVLDLCDAVLAEAIRELAPVERSVFLLKVIGEFKYREIADILQVPIGTVMSSLARGRARLRHRLVEYGESRGLLRPGREA